MRASVVSFFIGAVCLVSAAVSAEPPVTPTDAFVKALQAAPCPSGHLRNKNGLCPAVSTDTEGFSLFDSAPASGPATPNTGAPKAVIAHRTRVASITPPRSTLLAPVATGNPLSDLLITFKLGSAELTDHGKAQARSFAQALLIPALASAHVEIAGHTDASGPEALNMVLSQARADAVKAYMVSQGIDGARLTTKGYGSQDLAVPNSPRDAANRRVEARRLD